MIVRFPCGHDNHVDFEGRSRFICCSTCGVWAGVTREVERHVFYFAEPTNYSPQGNETDLR